jgi:NAD(P)-dependent dehydrogenase (short-subunit alcohol dehydrogenase family)
MNVLVTGSSSGIGFGLAKELCARHFRVAGISRRASELSAQFENYRHYQIDLRDFEGLEQAFAPVFEDFDSFDLVILNAGILGRIAPFHQQSIVESREVMAINVWANKAIIDLFLRKKVAVKQWVAISSGAAKNGSAGWGAYSVSKAALNMLIKTYAAENPESHFCALAPGLVDTQMQDYISSLPSRPDMPSIDRLKAAKGTPDMPDPISAAPMLLDAMQKALEYPGGVFLDVREL